MVARFLHTYVQAMFLFIANTDHIFLLSKFVDGPYTCHIGFSVILMHLTIWVLLSSPLLFVSSHNLKLFGTNDT